MRRFGELFDELDGTASVNEKLAALASYFTSAEPLDAAWGAYFLSGRRLKRVVGPATLRQWLLAYAGIAEWLLEETYAEVGDLAETIALLVEPEDEQRYADVPLSTWIERLLALPQLPPERQQQEVGEWWRGLDARSCFLLNKLLTGELRVGVASGLVERALAIALDAPRDVIARRLTGPWTPSVEFWSALRAPPDAKLATTRPYPFCLASPLDLDPAVQLGALQDWLVEWKWDGVRGQVMRRPDGVYIWSRGEELVTDRFPEIVQRALRLPHDVVLDGEILAWRDDGAAPFAELQQRLGRKTLSARLLAQVPVRFVAYDLLELEGRDIRAAPLLERRALLEALLHACGDAFDASPRVDAQSWEELAALRLTSRERGVEGLMVKRASSAYVAGRQRGAWWKWKVEPYTFDGVLVYAEPGRGRRANLLTDYTFAVRDGENLTAVAKAYSGLTDAEIGRVDRWIRQNTIERFGPVRAVRPELVFEIAFEGINASRRHKSGLAVRFPRIARWREDKPASEADTLEQLRRLLAP
jgi:DNA ligase-1